MKTTALHTTDAAACRDCEMDIDPATTEVRDGLCENCICPSCGESNTGGDGYDGYCGSCADTLDEQGEWD